MPAGFSHAQVEAFSRPDVAAVDALRGYDVHERGLDASGVGPCGLAAVALQVLRLICLQSLLCNGLKRYDFYKRELILSCATI